MRKLLFCTVVAGTLVTAQQFSDYRTRYDHFGENDVRAFEQINPYIEKAKKENNFPELFQAYKDAVSFTPDHKLDYADSLVATAALTGNGDLIATAFLTRGTVYYFNHKKFQPALDEYLKAWSYAKNSKNQYLYYKNLYHLGVIKSYLGYYEESLGIFKQCEVFFNRERQAESSPNQLFNSKKGYLNTLYQMGMSLIEMQQIVKAEQLVEKGLVECGAEADFYLERSYFHQLKGIIAYHQKRDSSAILALDNSLAGLERKKDFTSASIVYFYLGKSYQRLHQEEKAMGEFKKIDSIFTSHHFILPQVRESYEILINHYRDLQDKPLELYYTTQLLKADQILATDFKYLASKLHKEYDTGDLVAAKRRLETSISHIYLLAVVLGIALVYVILVLFQKKSNGFLLTFRKDQTMAASDFIPINDLVVMHKQSSKNTKVSDEVVAVILVKLAALEKNHFYLEKGMTLHKLAGKLSTNSTYLSLIIKEHRGLFFNAYLKKARIEYVTMKLRESKVWQHYSVETLAKECGFADRTNFSRAFKAHNQVSPVEFIQQLAISENGS